MGVGGDSECRNLDWAAAAGDGVETGWTPESESSSSFPSVSDSREESCLDVVVVRRAATEAQAALRRRQTRTKRRIKKRRRMTESSADLEGMGTCWEDDLRVFVTEASERKSGGEESDRFG